MSANSATSQGIILPILTFSSFPATSLASVAGVSCLENLPGVFMAGGMISIFANTIGRLSAWMESSKAEKVCKSVSLIGEVTTRTCCTFDYLAMQAIRGTSKVIENTSNKVAEENKTLEILFNGVSYISSGVGRWTAERAKYFKKMSLLEERKELVAIARIVEVLSESETGDVSQELIDFIHNLKNNDLKLVLNLAEKPWGVLLENLGLNLDKILLDMIENKGTWNNIGISRENLTDAQKNRYDYLKNSRVPIAFEQSLLT